MDKFLNLLPKNVLAFLLIAGGIFFIVVVYDPPHSICQSQLEVVNKAQAKFLFKDPKMKKYNAAETKRLVEECRESKNPSACYELFPTTYERLIEHCRASNNPGGCYELFTELNQMVHDLSTLSSECSAAMSDTGEYRMALMDSTELMVRIAWGEKPPATYAAKFGWLETADLSLFCRMRERISVLYGNDTWERFRERMMADLPGAKDLARNQVWELSLFSENCARYP